MTSKRRKVAPDVSINNPLTAPIAAGPNSRGVAAQLKGILGAILPNVAGLPTDTEFLQHILFPERAVIPGIALDFWKKVILSSTNYTNNNTKINYTNVAWFIIDLILQSKYGENIFFLKMLKTPECTEIGKIERLYSNLGGLFKAYYEGLKNPKPPATKEFAPLFGTLISTHLKTEMRTIFERLTPDSQSTQIEEYLAGDICFLCGKELVKPQLEHLESVIDALFGVIGIIQFLSRGSDMYVVTLPDVLILLFIFEYAYACAKCNGEKSNFRFVRYNTDTNRWYYDEELHKQKVLKLERNAAGEKIIPEISKRRFRALVYLKNKVMDYFKTFINNNPEQSYRRLNPILVFHVFCMSLFFQKITESAVIMLFVNLLLPQNRVESNALEYPQDLKYIFSPVGGPAGAAAGPPVAAAAAGPPVAAESAVSAVSAASAANNQAGGASSIKSNPNITEKDVRAVVEYLRGKTPSSFETYAIIDRLVGIIGNAIIPKLHHQSATRAHSKSKTSTHKTKSASSRLQTQTSKLKTKSLSAKVHMNTVVPQSVENSIITPLSGNNPLQVPPTKKSPSRRRRPGPLGSTRTTSRLPRPV